MGTGKIIQLIGVLAALVIGVVADFNYNDLIVVILGVVGGWFIAAEDRSRFLIATVALLAVQSALGPIPAVGQYISGALGGLASLFSAGAVTAIVLGTFEKLKP